MGRLLRQRNFALLWWGGCLSGLGDMVLFIALPFYTYGLTGSALSTGVMFIAQILPSLLLGSVAGVFADRWNRQATMIVADLLRVVVLVPLLMVTSSTQLWIVYMVAACESSIGQFFGPARGALLPQTVEQEQLLNANALDALQGQLTSVLGPSLGGLLASLFQFRGVVVVDIVSYLMSALLIGCMVLAPAPEPNHGLRPEGLRAVWISVWDDLRAGLQLVQRERWISGVFLVMGMLMVGQGIIRVMLVPFVTTVVHGGPREFGWMVTAQGIGGLGGGVLVARLGRFMRPTQLVTVSLVLLGLCWLGTAHSTTFLTIVLLAGLMGPMAMGIYVPLQTLLQQGIADRFRARVLGTLNTMQALLLLIGLGGASLTGDHLGTLIMFTFITILCFFAAIMVVTMISGSVQEAPLGVEHV